MNTLPYIVERTRNRSSRAVIQDDKILIRLAGRLSEREEERHIEVLLKRMTRAFLADQSRSKIDPFKPLFGSEASLTLKTALGIEITMRIVGLGKKTKAKPTSTGWAITLGSEGKRTIHRFFWKLLADSLREPVTLLVHEMNRATLGVRVNDVTVRFMRSRWGSCSNTGHITLSTPLFLTSPEIVRYVIIHELAHVPHPNHSARFWKTVEVFEPTYKEIKKSLKGYKLLSA